MHLLQKYYYTETLLILFFPGGVLNLHLFSVSVSFSIIKIYRDDPKMDGFDFNLTDRPLKA